MDSEETVGEPGKIHAWGGNNFLCHQRSILGFLANAIQFLSAMSSFCYIQEPLPDEDLTKMFKIPMAPSRLNPLILSGTISHTADEVIMPFSINSKASNLFIFRFPSSARSL